MTVSPEVKVTLAKELVYVLLCSTSTAAFFLSSSANAWSVIAAMICWEDELLIMCKIKAKIEKQFSKKVKIRNFAVQKWKRPTERENKTLGNHKLQACFLVHTS